ncbi:hypothetical protein DID88_005298 [Monilinia fructigena]|uniref:Uncharacterized protein n=1 Tax=Monilinia fructigena TaxID=38457 RepID=A0A395J067_9HELO|nr:hypothetical protein DID88_005298 [Monilinia fructigena]
MPQKILAFRKSLYGLAIFSNSPKKSKFTSEDCKINIQKLNKDYLFASRDTDAEKGNIIGSANLETGNTSGQLSKNSIKRLP